MSHHFSKLFSQYCLPQHLLSRLAGVVTNCKISWFKNALIDWFVRRYGVDMQEAQEVNPHHYPDFNSFFTRRLRAEVRPLASDEQAIICPSDGVVSQLGDIHAGKLLQAKGINYSVQQLLGVSTERAAEFQDGKFITLYLAPKDYHRVHMPLAGQLQKMIYVPGKLFSVNPLNVNTIPNLFARNERMVALFKTDIGDMAVVMVGALLVASIYTVWAGKITPSQQRAIILKNYEEQKIKLMRGDEVGHFQLGSTVIVLFANPNIIWDDGISINKMVRYGQGLARLKIRRNSND